ncbi:PilL N-terminal domain-containing protein [Pseudomonas synxantha]|uniref:Type IV pili sensor histidine kinase/response regulator n=1 Tax=Pseudomonas synxantha TaxID=47883 RepID=A0ACC6JVJ8_9PSED|nr:PilL N-terminal domain-containing protein [Pseudomonas synxantha]MDR6610548.1 type IV pili sensor histidine kinase/response regulator [Pseudomonas synxantha]
MPSLNTIFPVAILLSGLTLSGCKHSSVQAPQPVEHSVPLSAEKYIPVQRQGRYTLVELAPETAQQNLLLQMIDITLPSSWTISVGDALHYVLLHSGYRLCDNTAQIAPLLNFPIPAAHLSLGPIVLRDALQTLAGTAWVLQVNERTREVCFALVDEHSPDKTSAVISSTTEANP